MTSVLIVRPGQREIFSTRAEKSRWDNSTQRERETQPKRYVHVLDDVREERSYVAGRELVRQLWPVRPAVGAND